MELLPIFRLFPAHTAILESQARSPPVPLAKVRSAHTRTQQEKHAINLNG